MATIEQIGEWIIANQDKQGTPEFETVANAYKDLRSGGSVDEEAEQARIEEEYQAEMARINAVPEEPEEDDGGFLDDITPDQLEEFFKGLGGGAAGMLESAALGAITPFGEETESKLRDKIQATADPVQDFFSADKGSEDLIGRKLGEGVGSFLSLVGAAAIPVVGIPAAIGLGVGAGAGEASERAREGNATEEERGLASFLGAGVGATEFISPLRIFKVLKGGLGEDAASGFVASAKRIAKEAGVEGVQEFAAGVGQNLIEQGVYNPEQGTFEGGAEQFGMGAGVGGFVRAVVELITPRKRGGDTTPTREEQKVLDSEERATGLIDKEKEKRTKVVESTTEVPDPFDSSDIQNRILATQPKGSYNPDVNAETPTTVETSANVGARFTTDSEGATTDTDSVLASAQKLIDGGADLEDLSSAQKEALAKKYNIKFKKDTAPKQEKKKAPDNESTVIDPYPDITEETLQGVIDNNPNDLQAQELAREALAIKQKIKKQKDARPSAPAKDDVASFKTAKGSTYAVDAEGKTTRTKVDKSKGDAGLQPKSENTVFLKPEDVNKIGIVNSQDPKMGLEFSKDGTSVLAKNLTGPNKDKGIEQSQVNVSKKPAVGLIPLESFDGGKKFHFGNPITEVQDTAQETTTGTQTDTSVGDVNQPISASQVKELAKGKGSMPLKKAIKKLNEGAKFSELDAAEIQAIKDTKGKLGFIVPKDIKESTFDKKLQNAINADLSAGKSQKEIFESEYKKLGKTLGLTQSQYKNEIKILSDQKKAADIEVRRAEAVGRDVKADEKIEDTIKNQKREIVANKGVTEITLGGKVVNVKDKVKEASEQKTPAGQSAGYASILNQIRAEQARTTKFTKRDETSASRIDEELANINKQLAKKQSWSEAVKSLGEAYREIITNKKDPLTVEDKFKIQKLLLATTFTKESDAVVKKFFSKFERPIDALIVSGWESAHRTTAISSQESGVSSAELKFFDGINSEAGDTVLRWMNVNLGKKTKTYINNYTNEEKADIERIKKDAAATKRRATTATNKLKKSGQLEEALEMVYGKGTTNTMIDNQGYVTYKRLKAEAKAEKLNEELLAGKIKDEFSTETDEDAAFNSALKRRKRLVDDKNRQRETKAAKIQENNITPNLEGFRKYSVRELNKFAKEGRLSASLLTDDDFVTIVAEKPRVKWELVSLLDMKIESLKEKIEYIPTSRLVDLDMPMSPVVKAQAERGNLKTTLIALQNTTGSSFVAKMAKAFAGRVGNIKLKVEKNLIDASNNQVAGSYNPNTNTIILDAETGINAHVILHEMGHAITQDTLKKKSHPLTKQLTAIFNDTKDMLDTAYGAESVKEFVAEALSNPKFRQKLAGINPKGQPISSLDLLMNKIGNFLRTLFRMPTRALEGSALTEVDLLIDRILVPNKDSVGTGDLTAMSMIGQVESLTDYLSQRAKNTDTSADAKKGFISRIVDLVKDTEAGKKIKKFGLYSLPLQAVDDIAQKFPGLGPAATKLRKAIEEQVGLTNQMDERIDGTLNVFEKWLKGNPDKKELFDDIVYESTQKGVDPSKPSTDYKDEKLKTWTKLNKQYSRLGKEGQEVYKEMRDVYKSIYEDLQRVVGLKIDAAVEDKAEATEMKKTAFKLMFEGKNIEPYFPLTRKGDKWLRYEALDPATNTTEVIYESFETPSARDGRVEYLKQDTRVTSEIETYEKLSDVKFSSASPTAGLIKEIMAVVQKKQPASPSKQQQEAYNSTKEELMELFISGLPETSFARSMQKRGGDDGSGYGGFDRDAFDAFRTKAYDMSRQIARMESSNTIRAIESELREGWKKNGKDSNALLVLEELLERAQFSRNPPANMVNRLAGTANRVAFLGTIGFNVSSAIVNISQIPLMMLPILQGKYGKTGNAFSAIFGASGILLSSGTRRKISRVDFEKGKVDVRGMPSIDNYFEADTKGNLTLRKDLDLSKMSDKKREFIENDLKTLVKLAGRRGGLNRSLFYDTLGIEQAGRTRNIWDKANAWSAFAFHQVERYNRQVAMTATYKLELERMEKAPTAAEKKMSPEARREKAAEQAIFQSQEMNGGATLSTAPRIAQQGLGRVALMYKSYGIQMYYTMFKTLDVAMKGESKEVRSAAKKQLYGIVLSSTLLAGVSGIPLVGALMMVANLFLDDEEDDAETIMRKYMTEYVYKGPVSALGTDISSRIGLSNLLFRDNPYNNDASDAELLLGVIGGPAWSVGQSFSRGVTDVYRGNVERGVEAMLPAAFRNIYKGFYRYPRDEGILTRRGDVIHDDISTGGMIFQAIGFPPTEYTLKQEQNQQLKKIDRSVNERRTKLLKKYYVASRMGDNVDDILEDIYKFNDRHPQHGITAESVIRSMKMHALSSAKMHNGVTLTPKMRQILLENSDDFSSAVFFN